MPEPPPPSDRLAHDGELRDRLSLIETLEQRVRERTAELARLRAGRSE